MGGHKGRHNDLPNVRLYEKFVINKSRIFRENRTPAGMDDAAGGAFYERILGYKE